MKIGCDLCGKAVDDALLQIVDRGNEILYVCPDCFAGGQEPPPDEQP